MRTLKKVSDQLTEIAIKKKSSIYRGFRLVNLARDKSKQSLMIMVILIGSILTPFSTTLIVATVPTSYSIAVLNLANQTALTGLPSSAGVRIYLWNTTKTPHTLIASADVGTSEKVTFNGLPTFVWENSSWSISACLTWGGTDKGVLLLERTLIYDGTGKPYVYKPLATLLASGSPTSSLPWIKVDLNHNYALVQLSPFAFQVLDQAGYPATGASIQAFLNLTTHEVLNFGAKFVNGTFGSEFTGLMPGASANLKVGWAEFVLPAPRTTSGTTFKNITLLVRYKANGPVVGRLVITGFTDYSTFTYPITPYQLGVYSSSTSGKVYTAEPGNVEESLKIVSYNSLWSNIKWINIIFKDINGNDWLKKDAKIYFRWYENLTVAPYLGSTYDYGKAIVRIPSTLTARPYDEQFNFSLEVAVWRESEIVGRVDRVKPSSITSPYVVIITVPKNPTSLTLFLSKDKIVIGDRLVIIGQVNKYACTPEGCGIALVHVTLKYRPLGGDYIIIGDAVTNTTGYFFYMWNATPKVFGYYQLKASWPGDEDYAGSETIMNFTIIRLPSSISVLVNPQVSVFGQTININGSIVPVRVGVSVELIYYGPNGSVVSEKCITLESGSFSSTFTPDKAGEWKVKARWNGDENYEGAESNFMSFTVNKASTILTITVSEDTLEHGQSLVVSGSISPPMSSLPILLIYTRPDGSAIRNSVTTSTNGAFSETFTPDKDGQWSVKASWNGSENYLGATSSSINFNVKQPFPVTYIVLVLTIIAFIGAVFFIKRKKV